MSRFPCEPQPSPPDHTEPSPEPCSPTAFSLAEVQRSGPLCHKGPTALVRCLPGPDSQGHQVPVGPAFQRGWEGAAWGKPKVGGGGRSGAEHGAHPSLGLHRRTWRRAAALPGGLAVLCLQGVAGAGPRTSGSLLSVPSLQVSLAAHPGGAAGGLRSLPQVQVARGRLWAVDTPLLSRLGQNPVNIRLPIDPRSPGPGPIDGRRQLGRLMMKCQLLGGPDSPGI